jgi:Zn-finger nucleic acid-binding protein
MNVADAICCSGCGRELGLTPLTAETGNAGRPCPRCRETLVLLSGEHGVLFDCARCSGQFVQHALLRDLLEHREKLGRFAMHQPIRQELEVSKVTYVGCPECGQLMNRKNFGGTSGIVVDVCHQHGIWFDGAELSGVLAFVASGGPATSPTKAAAAEFKPFTAQGALTPAESKLTRVGDVVGGAFGIVDVGGELLSFVVGLITD